MADLDDTLKTLMTQGNFIRASDRLALEARARVMRADAVREVASAVAASVRGWFARRPADTRPVDHVRPRAA